MNFLTIKKSKCKNSYIRIKKAYYRVLLVAIFTLLFLNLYNKVFARIDRTYVEYEVKPGDRLWTIVLENYQDLNVDIRDLVYEIKDINDISGSIYPGQKVLLPEY